MVCSGWIIVGAWVRDATPGICKHLGERHELALALLGGAHAAGSQVHVPHVGREQVRMIDFLGGGPVDGQHRHVQDVDKLAHHAHLRHTSTPFLEARTALQRWHVTSLPRSFCRDSVHVSTKYSMAWTDAEGKVRQWETSVW